jgi:hypothetical protein
MAALFSVGQKVNYPGETNGFPRYYPIGIGVSPVSASGVYPTVGAFPAGVGVVAAVNLQFDASYQYYVKMGDGSGNSGQVLPFSFLENTLSAAPTTGNYPPGPGPIGR